MLYPWEILKNNKKILGKLKTSKIAKNVVVEKGAEIHGLVEIGLGSLLKSGVYIEGPVKIGKNCILGPNCYIRRYTNIGDDCKIGSNCEIKGSVVGQRSKIPHLSYIGDSVIGKNVNIGAGTITANLRHDDKNIKVKWGKKLIDTGMRKFGCYVGDYSKTAINTSIYPGVIMAPYCLTLPGQVVSQNSPCFCLGGCKINPEKTQKLWSEIDQKLVGDFKDL